MKSRLFFILAIMLFSGYTHATVQKLKTPAGEDSSFSRVFTDNHSTVYLSWVKQNPDKTVSTLFFSQLDEEGQHWQNPVQVASGSNAAKLLQQVLHNSVHAAGEHARERNDGLARLLTVGEQVLAGSDCRLS